MELCTVVGTQAIIQNNLRYGTSVPIGEDHLLVSKLTVDTSFITIEYGDIQRTNLANIFFAIQALTWPYV